MVSLRRGVVGAVLGAALLLGPEAASAAQQTGTAGQQQGPTGQSAQQTQPAQQRQPQQGQTQTQQPQPGQTQQGQAQVQQGQGQGEAQPGQGQTQQTQQGQTQPTWLVTLTRTTPFESAADDAQPLAELPPFTLLEVSGYAGPWAQVVNPRTRATFYVDSSVLAPSDPPSRYLTMAPPPAFDQFQARGVVTDAAALALYPTDDPDAIEKKLDPSTWLTLTGAVEGADGALWYTTDSGDFVKGDEVFLPERIDDYAGRWMDVDLSVPTRVSLYEGSDLVDSFLAIKGTGPRPTPTGVFTILRRVANETMNSDTIGIPRFGPGGYYLTNVLFTQYFTGDGASLHYNYWSSNFGYAGSHGCLGLTYKDSAFLWEWAQVGTPLIIHY